MLHLMVIAMVMMLVMVMAMVMTQMLTRLLENASNLKPAPLKPQHVRSENTNSRRKSNWLALVSATLNAKRPSLRNA